MAIAYSTTGTGQFTNPGTSGSFAANVGSGTDRILWVATLHDSYTSADLFTGITYNGVALTKVVGRRLNTSDQYVALWYLLNPASGSNTLAATLSSSCYSYGAWAVYTGAPAASTVIGSNTASADVASGTLTLSLTTQGDLAWLVSGVRSTDTGDHTAGAGTTRRAQLGAGIGDGQSEKTPTGSYSNAWSANPSGKIGGVMAHFYVASTSLTINVSDTLTITESVSLSFTSFINKSDTITITESVQMALAQTISVFDSIAITENVTINNTQLGGVNVNDAITISESVTVTNTALGNINVNDSITITENVSITKTIFTTIGPANMRSDQQDWPLAMDDDTIL